jgi:hypothetical protein
MIVVITDCDYKHSIALQRHIRDALPDVHLVGHSPQSIRYARYYRYCQTYIPRAPLADVIRRRDIDMVIPVGATSVQTVCEVARDKAVLPLEHHLRICYDKSEATALAASLGIAVPRTVRLRHSSDAADVDMAFPCVVKSANEVEGKFVWYPRDRASFKSLSRKGYDSSGWSPAGSWSRSTSPVSARGSSDYTSEARSSGYSCIVASVNGLAAAGLVLRRAPSVTPRCYARARRFSMHCNGMASLWSSSNTDRKSVTMSL